MDLLILAAGALLILAVLSARVSERLRIPVLLLFLSGTFGAPDVREVEPERPPVAAPAPSEAPASAIEPERPDAVVSETTGL